MSEPMAESTERDRGKKGLPGGPLHMCDFSGRVIPRPEDE